MATFKTSFPSQFIAYCEENNMKLCDGRNDYEQDEKNCRGQVVQTYCCYECWVCHEAVLDVNGKTIDYLQFEVLSLQNSSIHRFEIRKRFNLIDSDSRIGFNSLEHERFKDELNGVEYNILLENYPNILEENGITKENLEQNYEKVIHSLFKYYMMN